MQHSKLARAMHIDNDGKLTIQRTQNVQPILDRNHRLRDMQQTGEVRHVASIPMGLVEHFHDKYGINVLAPSHEDAKRILKLLNSPEYAYLRTSTGRL